MKCTICGAYYCEHVFVQQRRQPYREEVLKRWSGEHIPPTFWHYSMFNFVDTPADPTGSR